MDFTQNDPNKSTIDENITFLKASDINTRLLFSKSFKNPFDFSRIHSRRNFIITNVAAVWDDTLDIFRYGMPNDISTKKLHTGK